MKDKRGFVTTCVDRLLARYTGYPPETCTYTVTNARIPILEGPDSFELAADLYQPVLPDNAKPKGTILIRCPYGRGVPFSLLGARPYAARGYQCLMVSCRGTFGSGGVFEPWQNEEEDGQAVVTWMRKQDWYTGSFITQGGSYLGFTQWALLRNPPHDMVAAIIQCAPHDFSQQLWGTGSLALEWITWGDRILHQEETGFLAMVKAYQTPKRLLSVLQKHPLPDSVKAHFKGRVPWLDTVVDQPDTSAPVYNQMKFGEALDNVNIPIFLIGGWQDLFVRQTIQQYTQLKERNVPVTLLMGGWNHMQVGLDAKAHRKSFDWLERHLAKKDIDCRSPNVHYLLTGANIWRDAPTWPPPTTQHTLYLSGGNKLTYDEPSMGPRLSSSFTFDHLHPTPTIGGNLLLQGGNADDTALATRSDVLTFTSDPLDATLEVLGQIIVELTHSSDTPNVDLWVRVSEVNSNGRSQSVTETYQRLDSTRTYDKVVLGLDNCAHRFSKGNCVRVMIAGSSWPRYALISEDAVHTVHYNGETVSKVVLPVAA